MEAKLRLIKKNNFNEREKKGDNEVGMTMSFKLLIF